MAEGKGFEPPKGISSFNDLANRRLQPLGHPSAGVCVKQSRKAPPTRIEQYTAYAGTYLALKTDAVKSEISRCNGFATAFIGDRLWQAKAVFSAALVPPHPSSLVRRIWFTIPGLA